MAATNCDPRALRLARRLHQTVQPEVTILYGSRARGDYRDGDSDIDIMLVQENEPSEDQKSRARRIAQNLAKAQYTGAVPVQIVWQTSQEFGRMRRAVNHLVSNALREGIVMPRNLEEYSNRYAADYDDQEFEWTITDQRYRHAEVHLDSFHSMIDLQKDDLVIGQQAQNAMEHALKAVISANGERYPRTHDINQLTEKALQWDPEFQFTLSVPGEVYNQYAGSDEYYDARNPLTSIPDYRELVDSDVEAVMQRVREIRQGQP